MFVADWRSARGVNVSFALCLMPSTLNPSEVLQTNLHRSSINKGPEQAERGLLQDPSSQGSGFRGFRSQPGCTLVLGKTPQAAGSYTTHRLAPSAVAPNTAKTNSEYSLSV